MSVDESQSLIHRPYKPNTMATNQQQFLKDLEDLLKDALKETGVEAKQSGTEIARYMHERAVHLSTLTNEPGFQQAVRAERNNVAMFAGLELSNRAEALDQRIIGVIQGILGIAARLLVIA